MSSLEQNVLIDSSFSASLSNTDMSPSSMSLLVLLGSSNSISADLVSFVSPVDVPISNSAMSLQLFGVRFSEMGLRRLHSAVIKNEFSCRDCKQYFTSFSSRGTYLSSSARILLIEFSTICLLLVTLRHIFVNWFAFSSKARAMNSAFTAWECLSCSSGISKLTFSGHSYVISPKLTKHAKNYSGWGSESTLRKDLSALNFLLLDTVSPVIFFNDRLSRCLRSWILPIVSADWRIAWISVISVSGILKAAEDDSGPKWRSVTW